MKTLVVSKISINRKERREEKIKLYIDSINNYKGAVMPGFLLDECFDWNASLWEGLHSPVSLRWKILSMVNNKKALEMILDTHDKRLKKKCSHKSDKVYPFLSIPMIEKSFYQLIKERYREL